MRTHSGRSLIVIALIALTTTARADWTTDPGPSGLLVRPNVGSHQVVTSDGAGGALIGFEVYGVNSRGPIYVQEVGSHGQLPWGGMGVYSADPGLTLSDWGLAIVQDGSGGAVIVWRRAPNSGLPDLLAQRIDGNGAALWPHAYLGDGVSLTSGSLAAKLAWWVAQDGAGGFVTAWLDARVPSPYAWFAQRIDANGTIQWGSQGINLGIGTPLTPSFAVDGAGGLIAFWGAPGASGDNDLFAQRFGANGSPLWGPGGIAVCSLVGDQGTGSPGIAAVSDGAGGACVAWIDRRIDSQGDVFAQRIDASGVTLWMAGGVPLCSVAGAQAALVAVPDGSGGLIAAWEDSRASGATGIDLYAQRIGGGGVVLWVEGGAVLCDAPGDQTEQLGPGEPSNVAADGAGGLFAAWADARSDALPGTDIFAQHIDGSGIATWPASGLRFGSTSGTLSIPSVVPDGDGGCAVFWQSTPGTDAGPDLRGRGSSGPTTGVEPGGQVASFALRGASPNPAMGPFTIAFSLVEPGDVRVDVLDVAGRLVWRRDDDGLGPGPHAFRTPDLRPGLYLVRLTQGPRFATTKAIVIR
jgi:type IX secretion system substrate protein